MRELARKFDEQLAQIPGEGWASVTTVSREGSQERGRAEEFAELRDRLAGETRSLSVAMTEARALPNEDGGYTIEGHAAVFDSASYPLPDGRGGTFVEVVKRGAFRKALANPETPTALLMNHDANLILASSGSGTGDGVAPGKAGASSTSMAEEASNSVSGTAEEGSNAGASSSRRTAVEGSKLIQTLHYHGRLPCCPWRLCKSC